MFDYLLQFLMKLSWNGLIGAGAPSTLSSPLKFCSYNETACCNSTEDLQIQKQFQTMNISNSGCASLLKSVLCAVRLLSFPYYIYPPNSVFPILKFQQIQCVLLIEMVAWFCVCLSLII